MFSTWNSGETLPSQTFGQGLYQDHSKNGRCLTFVDFFPECLKQGGIFSSPEYETFGVLIDRANGWLRANPKWELKTCESVEFNARRDRIETDKMVYLEYGKTLTRYVRGLRLWLTEKTDDEIQQQIGYLNLLPQQTGGGTGIFSTPKFESLGDLVTRFNTMMRTSPMRGRIITVESQEMKISHWTNLDPDISSWTVSNHMMKHFLFALRIFFDKSDGVPEELGLVDFVPATITSGGILTLPKYEPFSTLIEKASNWCMKQEGIRICNAQSLEIKISRGSEVNTQNMAYTESSSMNTYYVRILRMAYIKPSGHLSIEKNSPFSLNKLTCKTIVPVQLTSGGMMVPKFETFQETKNRVSAWVKATGIQVINAETAALRFRNWRGVTRDTEESLAVNRADWQEYWIFVIRLYISGSYQEPPMELLPPVPELEEKHCCIVL